MLNENVHTFIYKKSCVYKSSLSELNKQKKCKCMVMLMLSFLLFVISLEIRPCNCNLVDIFGII